MQNLETKISLPQGILSRAVVQQILRLIFESFRWFTPARYGTGGLDKRLAPGRFDLNKLLAFYEEWQALCVGGNTDRDFLWIFPARPIPHPYVGAVSWTTAEKSASKPGWRDAHTTQVRELMTLVGSPLTISASVESIDKQTRHWIPDEVGRRRVLTVRDHSEGLAGLFWRNFYGPPFVRLFGERLSSLPVESRRDLGNGVVLVQPYELPGEGDTEQGKARERALIQHLGPECFYDHERHLKPTRLPDLSSIASQT